MANAAATNFALSQPPSCVRPPDAVELEERMHEAWITTVPKRRNNELPGLQNLDDWGSTKRLKDLAKKIFREIDGKACRPKALVYTGTLKLH